MYKTLFNINIYHSYFLDEGTLPFFKFSDASTSNNGNNNGNNGNANNGNANSNSTELEGKDRERAEAQYNVNDFLSIVPTEETKKAVKNHRLLLRNHKKGIRVLAETLEVITEGNNQEEVALYSPIITLPDSLTLTFYLKVHHPYFENFSNVIEKNKQQLYYLSNKSSSVLNVFETISEVKKWSDFLLSDSETRKLVHQLETMKEFETSTPNLVTIANIKEEKLAEIETKIANETALDTEEQEIHDAVKAFVKRVKNNRVIGVLQLQISGEDSNDFTEQIMTKNKQTQQFDVEKQCLLATFPEFKVCIQNRTTFWRYTKTSENLVMTTIDEQPLTMNGRVEIKNEDVSPQPQDSYYFPNPTPESITQDPNNQNYYSEVFI
ncbi:hypothetical protein P8625_08530 [Tenacibaculum tangerinum]|uniref:Uncharacterized protein n=1 Tax=Tenacibaculum tangerinum TaxID=3038772 RepID=A0ABY8KYT5_9FLAO|nr:hypothetical protein [Tenacibaculum tangerinum]WGH74166.1 hypothetical protein P8625_08530 [Tenacibaculum tangerinum]